MWLVENFRESGPPGRRMVSVSPITHDSSMNEDSVQAGAQECRTESRNANSESVHSSSRIKDSGSSRCFAAPRAARKECLRLNFLMTISFFVGGV